MFAALSQADSRDASLRVNTLCNADLTGARFDGVSLVDVTMHAADRAGARREGVDASFSRILATKLGRSNPRRAAIERASLVWLDRTAANLVRANAVGVGFMRTNPHEPCSPDAKLRGASFADANPMRAGLGGADLRGAGLGRALPHRTRLSGSERSRALRA